MTADEQAIHNLAETWLEATQKGDIATVLTLMADDVVFMTPGQEPFGKEAFAASAAKMTDMRIDGTSKIQEIKVIGDSAWMRRYNAMCLMLFVPVATRMTRCKRCVNACSHSSRHV